MTKTVIAKKIIFSVVAVAVIFVSAIYTCAFMLDSSIISAINEPVDFAASEFSSGDYDSYIIAGSDLGYGEDEILIQGGDNSFENGSDSEVIDEESGKTNVLKWDSGKGSVTYSFDISYSGLYCIYITYKQIPFRGNDIQMGLRIDDKYLFDELRLIEFPRLWTDDGSIKTDPKGNQYSPEQKEYQAYVEYPVRDKDGITSDPFRFALSEGQHSLTLELRDEALYLACVRICAPDPVLSYKETSSGYGDLPAYSGTMISIQGEDASIKTSKYLPAKSDSMEAGLTPASPTVRMMNYIGGKNWSDPGDSITWEFDAPSAGLYKLGFKYKQGDLVNGISYRRLEIDDKEPFSEARSIAFHYGHSWDHMVFGDENQQPYLIYLDEGPHTLKLSVTLADTAEIYKKLSELVADIGDEYLKITSITGETPDPYRDYDLFRQIPDFNKTLTDIYERLTALAEDITNQTGQRSNSIIAAVKSMARVVKLMIDNPYTAQQYKSDYFSKYSSLSAWLYDMKEMPLSIDEIILASPDEEHMGNKAGFWEAFSFSVRRFLYSFSNDYRTLSEGSDRNKSVKIWVNWGRDQTQVLNTLIRERFTPSTGIDVNLEIVNAGIVKGLLSGAPPDLALHMPRTEPVDLAMRGALYDLTRFPDFEEVMGRFQPSAGIPYMYEGGCYALPDTQAFYMMFYREDILSRLGIEAPSTWDEFLDASITIQRNKMSVWMPYTRITSAATIHTGIGGLSLFPTFMLQNGLSVYDEDMKGSALDTREAIAVFEYWINFYDRYKFPREANFYNRFRVGTMPLGIEVYTFYQTLTDAAPEIKDRWAIAPIPGTVGIDGQIINNCSGSGTGAGILADTGREDIAWEFIKWWTSAETQSAYSNNVESIIGVLGRTATANVEALKSLSWKSDDLDIILRQWEKVEEVPEIPGSYYLTRAIDQAFWNVTNRTSKARDSIVQWNQTAENEIRRKISEYGQ